VVIFWILLDSLSKIRADSLKPRFPGEGLYRFAVFTQISRQPVLNSELPFCFPKHWTNTGFRNTIEHRGFLDSFIKPGRKPGIILKKAAPVQGAAIP
jgi:hypothetical protein